MGIVRKVIQRGNRKSLKHEGHLWCNGVKYFPRDVAALESYNKASKKIIHDLKKKLQAKDNDANIHITPEMIKRAIDNGDIIFQVNEFGIISCKRPDTGQ